MRLAELVVVSLLLTFGCCAEPDVTHDRLAKIENVMQYVVSSIDELKRNKEEQGGKFQNDTTIEERVAVLEFQVVALTDDVTDLGEDVNLVEVEQVLQDEKILELQIDSENFEASIENLVATDVSLLVELSDVNSRVSNLNGSLNEVDGIVMELDTELSALEDTVSQIDGRVSQLELSGTVAFQADLDAYTSIPIGSVVIFDVVDLNLGEGYNSTTGQFTVPTGGAGLYFIYINFYADDAKVTNFVVRVNGAALCYARGDLHDSVDDNGTPSCGAVTTLSAGDVVDVLYEGETDDFPVNSDTRPYNTFTGFRIAPE